MREMCERLHNIANSSKRYTFKTGFEDIPLNGIYIMFEKGEAAHNGDRIVRVGTHTGDNQLPSRINQHFLLENKNRSIFRKNIGRCFLIGNDYAEKWEYKTTSRMDKDKYLHLLNFQFEKQIEKQITQYIHDNFSFTIIKVPNKDYRLQLEAELISTVSNCNECKPSLNWLGMKSPKTKIRQSGLWQVNEVFKNQCISPGNMEFIEKAIER